MDSGSLIVDKPLVCGRGLPGRLSSHCSSIQHGRSTALTSSLVALPASLGSSYRPALRWPGIPGLRSASRCPRPFTPSGLRRQRPVSLTARGLRAPRRRRPSVPPLRTACARASSRFAASNGQRPGRECIFPANASICSAKNARNDVHAVISDLSLVLPILCQCSESRYPAKWIAALIFI